MTHHRLAILLAILVGTACSANPPPATLPSSMGSAQQHRTALTGIKVSGNHLVDGNNDVVDLHGVNRSGTEYACVQGWGIFDGPSDSTSIQAMTTWNVNVVRVPLNEDCWLGITVSIRSMRGRTT
ncbi:MAG TPA: hypothetical protein VHT92_02375 [Candidatus Cybelea sp.]|nr:hypothetical protein [Candidatus Cybelea sp.]